MAAIQISVTCDRALATHLALELGGTWNRINLRFHEFSFDDAERLLRQAAGAFRGAGAQVPCAAHVKWDEEAESMLKWVALAWTRAWGGGAPEAPDAGAQAAFEAAFEAASEAATEAASEAAAEAASKPPYEPPHKLGGAPRPASSPAPRVGPRAAGPRVGPRAEQLLRTARQYIAAHGAAPDFSSDKPAAKARAHNYIRSVTAAPNAPDDVVEEVRRALAAQG